MFIYSMRALFKKPFYVLFVSPSAHFGIFHEEMKIDNDQTKEEFANSVIGFQCS